jgi:D-3-phosphoglycerate dehydrogenase / 2-oxoglutarate reductase
MNILITHPADELALYYGEDALMALRRHGEVRLNTRPTPLDTAELIRAAEGCAIIVADRQTAVQRDVFDALPDLLAVLRCAMDVSNIDLAAADRSGVLVTRASAGFIDSVAELAVGYMIDLARGISDAVLAYRSHQTPTIRVGGQLSGSTVGIIGYGAIGQRVGALAQALGMTVLATDPAQSITTRGIEQVDLPVLLARSQFVICLAPATPATENLMNAQAFAVMRRGSFFINLSRSSLVDEAALEQALDRGHLAGAALDVGSDPDQKPPPRLAARQDVIATPHIGGLTPQAVVHQAFDTVRQAEAVASGRVPEGAVNAPRAFRLAQIETAPP